METRNCQQCGKSFLAKTGSINKGYGKFCGRECARLWRIGRPHAGTFKKGHKLSEKSLKKLSASLKGRPSSLKGRLLSEEHRAKLSIALRGRAAWNSGTATIEIRHCQHCGAEFQAEVTPSRTERGKFCSKACANKGKTGKQLWPDGRVLSEEHVAAIRTAGEKRRGIPFKHDKQFQKGFVPHNKGKPFRHSGTFKIGHPRYTNHSFPMGHTPWNYIDGRGKDRGTSLYGGAAWERIRNSIRERDRNQCNYCGESEKKLHVHHLVPFRVSHDNSAENLVLACVKCHRREEKKWVTVQQEGLECYVRL